MKFQSPTLTLFSKVTTMIFVSVSFLGSVASAQSETPAVGFASYAMLSPEWPCENARQAEASLLSLHHAILWNTFGTDFSCLDEYMKDKRLKTLEIHLINEVCQRNNRCGSYEFLSGLSVTEYQRKLVQHDEALLERLKEYVSPLATYVQEKLPKHTRCLISPGLESNLNNKAASILIDELRPLFPTCEFVWNPNRSNRKASPIDTTLYELHHSDAKLNKPCIANLDGEDIVFPTREAKLSHSIASVELKTYLKNTAACDVSYLWIAEFNGLETGKFLDPRQRPKERFPTFKTFRLLAKTIKQLIEETTLTKPSEEQMEQS
jgi:hypothetical protein